MQIRLVSGAGSPTTGACWMSAASYYAGEKWSDHPACVDPVIRRLCIRVNDGLPSDAERERVIGPHLLVPLGTAKGRELMQRRAFRVADEAVRVWAPMALEQRGQSGDAATVHALAPIVDIETARAAAAAAYAYAANAAAAYAAAAYAAAAANVDAANAAEHLLLPLILELCAMGRDEVPQRRSLADLPQSVTS